MVQLKRDLPLPGDGELDNTYWAIGRNADETESMKLRHRDYRPKPISGDEMILRNDRHDRGLLVYQDCLVRELKGFIQARGLKLPQGSRVKKEHFIQVLENADEESEFPKFLDLPAELRDNIYEKYFDALAPLPPQPHQPPLTLVPNLIRTESLPRYYNNSTFTFAFLATSESGLGFAAPRKRTVFCDNTAALLSRIDEQTFARIRRLNLDLWEHRLVRNYKLKADENRLWAVATWYVDLHGSTGPVMILHHQVWRPDEFVRALNFITQRLVKVMNEIRARSSTERLHKDDFDNFRRAMHVAVSK